jgi:hypothetical protein
MEVRIDATEARIFASLSRDEAKRFGQRVPAVTQHYGQLLLTRIQANASGRPGPRAVTGNYRRSWVLDVSSTPAGS